MPCDDGVAGGLGDVVPDMVSCDLCRSDGRHLLQLPGPDRQAVGATRDEPRNALAVHPIGGRVDVRGPAGNQFGDQFAGPGAHRESEHAVPGGDPDI